MVSMKFVVLVAILGLAMVAQPSLQQGYGGTSTITVTITFSGGSNSRALQVAVKGDVAGLLGSSDSTITPPPTSRRSLLQSTFTLTIVTQNAKSGVTAAQIFAAINADPAIKALGSTATLVVTSDPSVPAGSKVFPAPASPAPTTPTTPVPTTTTGPVLATGKVIGDPHFTGFDGKTFDFQGENNKVYSLLSDDTVELRALLGEDLMFKGTTVMRSLGLQVGEDKIRTDILGDAISNTWRMTLTINDIEMSMDSVVDMTLPSSGARLQFAPPIFGQDNQIMIQTQKYVFVFVEPKNIEDPSHPRFHDRFDMAIEVLEAPTAPLGGVLGATWPTPTNMAASKPSTIQAVKTGDAAATASFEVGTIFKRTSLVNWFKAM